MQHGRHRVAVIGAGWAGCAAAVQATGDGHQVTLFEAARRPGGRARAVELPSEGAGPALLDNGQHILIGAYSATLELMARVGVDSRAMLERRPLSLTFPDGSGLALPAWPAPLDALAGILLARGWRLVDKLSLLRTAWRWRQQGFSCAPRATVDDLCDGLTGRVRAELIEPLCVSALNTPTASASGAVFLRVLRDSLFGPAGSSQLLLPRSDLGSLLPVPALDWLQRHGATLRLGHRVQRIARRELGWEVDDEVFDTLLLATPPWESARLLEQSGAPAAAWLDLVHGLRYESITTVYLAGGKRLMQPMLALRSDEAAPAQFVFDRGQLGGPEGLLAFVVSASHGAKVELEAKVCAQAAAQLGLHDLRPVQTIVEKRATFACLPGLLRPAQHVLAGLLACGDYVEGPYPSTLEGAVRSGLRAARSLGVAAAASTQAETSCLRSCTVQA